MIDQVRIDANWRAITFELDAPIPSRLERVLRRVGFSSATARLVGATPALRRSWVSSLVAVVLIGLGSADSDPSSLAAMLTLAPLIPVLGVALAYGPAVDPVHEIGLATPMRGLRLLMIRATTVLAVAVGVLASTVLASSAPGSLAFAWLLPGLALSSLTVGAMTVTTPRRAVAAVSVGWLLVATIARVAASDSLAVFRPAAQLIALAVAAGAGVVIVRRHESFDRLVA